MKEKRKNEDDLPRRVAPGRVEPDWIEQRQVLHDAGQLLRDVGLALLVVFALALLGLIALSGALRAW